MNNCSTTCQVYKKNILFNKFITIYQIGTNLTHCEDCIKEKLLICSYCGFFKIKGNRIKPDSLIKDYHPNMCHNFIIPTNDILDKLLVNNEYGYFNYKI